MIPDFSFFSLLSLLQLASPALPVGAYSYSEGLEMLVERSIITSEKTLQDWIEQELAEGAIYLDGAVMVRALNAANTGNWLRVEEWNAWSSASRETEELREQSLQMGNALLRLLLALLPGDNRETITSLAEGNCNFAVAFALAASYWQIAPEVALLGYLQSWSSNVIGAGVKLIPLGQTAGQQVLFNLQSHLVAAVERILTVKDDELSSCTWGLSLASMQHETQYSRLFRS
jgi:urease accessory protein